MTKQEFINKWTEKFDGDWIYLNENNDLALDTGERKFELWKEFFKDYELFIKKN